MSTFSISGIDRKMVRQSNIKIIKCGNIFELYEYQIPYIYNLGKVSTSTRDKEEDSPSTVRNDNIARTQRKIKRLINSNSFVYGFKPVFITYTFAKNIKDIKEANRKLKNHHLNLARLVGRRIRCLTVPELQKRGAIHYHIVYFDLPYIPNIKKVFQKSWGHGFLKIKVLYHVKNIGAYISKYFSKQWASERVIGTKGFFSSSNLFQPEIYRDVAILSKYGNLVKEFSEPFFSNKFGTIQYSQFRVSSSDVEKITSLTTSINKNNLYQYGKINNNHACRV